MDYTREQLEGMKASELRVLAVRQKLGAPHWRRLAKKDALIGVLLGETEPEEIQDAENSAAQAFIDSLLALTSAHNVLDEAQVRDLVRTEIERAQQGFVKQLEVRRPDGAIHRVEGRTHASFENLLAFIGAGCNVWLTGPAGSGKTFAAEQVAKALGLPFYCQSVGAQTAFSHLVGYMDATGTYRGTVFRTAFEHGGVFLLDEVDAGNPNVLTALNAALANGVCSFPDGMVVKHEQFVCVAAANTYGNGRDRKYVGRNQLDATTLDRFVTLDWSYDETMETALVGLPAWTRFVQAVRKAVGELSIEFIVSPRASINGAKLLRAGVAPAVAIQAAVFKGLDGSAVHRIEAKLSEYSCALDEAEIKRQIGEELEQQANAAGFAADVAA